MDLPELVIEVGWSQTKEDVEENATKYLGHFNGQIQTVVGINLHDMFEEQDAVREKWMRNKLSYEKGDLQSEPKPLLFLDQQAAAMSAYFSVWRLDAGRRAVKNRVRFPAMSTLQIPPNDSTFLTRL
jgi:cobyric acid synthase